MTNSKILAIALLTISILLLSGCIEESDPSQLVRNLPEVQEFLAEHPNAKIVATKLSAEIARQLIDDIRQDCGQQMQVKEYRLVIVSEGNERVEAYFDTTTNEALCIVEEKEPQPPKEECKNNDGKCPTNCNPENDNDCFSTDQCTTDSQCNDADHCTIDMCTSTPKRCYYITISACINNDNCCPTNCTNNNDNDCPTNTISLCTEDDWTSNTSPTTCPTTQQQTKTWNKIGQCQEGTEHPSSETITCNYQIPTCTSFTYTTWGVCTQSGTQSRNVLSSTPNGCQGGNPTTTQTCNYIPPCTENNWTSNTSPTTCPSSRQQTKTWTKIGNCQNGVTHPSSETITCNYQICNNNGSCDFSQGETAVNCTDDCSNIYVNLTYHSETEKVVLDMSAQTNPIGTYAYAPSIMYWDGKYHLWACSNTENYNYANGLPNLDVISYITSNDGITWSSNREIVFSLDKKIDTKFNIIDTCDPSVVRFSPPGNSKTYFYLFFTALHRNKEGFEDSWIGSANGVARSENPNGPYNVYVGGDPLNSSNWVYNTTDIAPYLIQTPYKNCSEKVSETGDACYGAGQPSVVNKDGVLHMWYTDDTYFEKHILYTTSINGVNWANPQITNLNGISSVSVEYDEISDKFILLFWLNHFSDMALFVAFSDDGVSWSNLKIVNDGDFGDIRPYSHNLGLSGNENGFILRNQKSYLGFGSPYPGASPENYPPTDKFDINPGTTIAEWARERSQGFWDIFLSEMNLDWFSCDEDIDTCLGITSDCLTEFTSSSVITSSYTFNGKNIVNVVGNKSSFNNGSSILDPSFCKYGWCVGFDGIDDSFTMNYTQLIDNFAFGGWAFVEEEHEIDPVSIYGGFGQAGQKYLFYPNMKGTIGAGVGLSVGTNGISLYEHAENYLSATVVYSQNIGSGWHHIFVNYKDKTPSIYLDGTLVSCGFTSYKSHVYSPTIVGGGKYGYFKGKVDEIKVYTDSLNSSQVKMIYEIEEMKSRGVNLDIECQAILNHPWDTSKCNLYN